VRLEDILQFAAEQLAVVDLLEQAGIHQLMQRLKPTIEALGCSAEQLVETPGNATGPNMPCYL
jgi:hypothetical protein